MVTPHGWGYVLMLVLAAALGGVGGFAAELLQTRGSTTGAIQLPSRGSGQPVLVQLGFWSSVIIGAVAGVAVLYLLPPTVSTGSNTATTYDVVKGAALALIAGSAGRTLLTTLQAKVDAGVSQQQAQTMHEVAQQAADHQATAVKTDVTQAVEAAVTKTAPDMSPHDKKAIVEDAVQTVAEQAEQRAAGVKEALSAVAPPPP